MTTAALQIIAATAPRRGRGRPRSLPITPPAGRAPAVLEQRPALERELSELKLKIAETTLAAYEGKPDGRKNLAALHNEISSVMFQLEGNGAAHQLAQRLDREALAGWFAALQDNPNAAVEGITKTECCKRCSEAQGCVITGSGGVCGHPIFAGTVGPALMGNPRVRAVFKAAAEKLGVYR